MINFIRYCIILIISTQIMSSCGKSGCNVIPNMSFTTTLDRVNHSEIYAVTGWSYAEGGICGLIVYNTGAQGLIAYDRCSTVNSSQKNRVIVEGNMVVDPESGAKWLLMDGSPAAIAECPLKPYQVRKNGDYYTVSN